MNYDLAITNCRVSSEEQLKNNSLTRQGRAVLEAASRLGAKIPEDGQWSGHVSSKRGNNIKRKDINQMLDYCKKHKGVKYLIVDEPDRFMRSVDEAFYIEMQFKLIGVRVWYASDEDLNSDDMPSKLMKFMKYFVAEGSNEERQRKSISGQTAALKEGRWTFPPKTGYMKGKLTGIPEVHPILGPEIQANLKRLVSGLVSPTNGLQELNRSKFGEYHAPFKMDKYRKMATDIFYAGYVQMNKQVQVEPQKAQHAALITLEEHHKLVDIFNKKPKYQIGPRRKGNPEFPLNNIVEHDLCLGRKNKGRLVGFPHNNGKSSTIYYRYRCRSCGKYYHREVLHPKVTDMLAKYEFSDDAKTKIIEALKVVWAKDSQHKTLEANNLNSRISTLKKDIDTKVEGALDNRNALIKDEILSLIEKKKKELSDANMMLAKLTSDVDYDKEEFMRFALSFINDVGSHLLEPSMSKENRLACKLLLFPGGIQVDSKGKIYTPETSVFFRGKQKKKDAEASDNSHLVRVRGL